MSPHQRRFISDCVWILVLVLVFLLSSAAAVINLTRAPSCEQPEAVRTVCFPTPQTFRVQEPPPPATAGQAGLRAKTHNDGRPAPTPTTPPPIPPEVCP